MKGNQSISKILGLAILLLGLLVIFPVDQVYAVDPLAILNAGMQPVVAEKDTAVVKDSITRLYRMHLNRDPGNWGVDFYSDKIMNEGWDLKRVEGHLKSTKAYKQEDAASLKQEIGTVKKMSIQGASLVNSVADVAEAAFADELNVGLQAVLVADGLTRVPKDIATLTDYEKNEGDVAAVVDLAKTGARGLRMGSVFAQDAGIFGLLEGNLGTIGSVAGRTLKVAGVAGAGLGLALNTKSAYDKLKAGDKQGAALSGLKAGLSGAALATCLVPGAQVLAVPIIAGSLAVTAYEHRDDLAELGQKTLKGIKKATGWLDRKLKSSWKRD